ncbi:MAG: Rrf2 family transcriptional regulator [Verrucomicrobia bacterium]|nr:Rrf2 family transcriptional regulator [Verrucomicrobiota bacterium]MCH8512901.1 Rrf2 family transcriptional regulator [Kiritimatiellia bacterium]
MISKKCTYALKAVLALARRQGSGPMTIQQIAELQDIPPRFLEAILRDLKQNGFTESIRGKEGGYVLSRPARDISLGEIIRCVEGPWFSPSAEVDVFTAVWQEAENALNHVMDETDFQSLLRKEDALRRAAVPDYSI